MRDGGGQLEVALLQQHPSRTHQLHAHGKLVFEQHGQGFGFGFGIGIGIGIGSGGG